MAVLRPRTIRGQLMAGLIFFELLALLVFGVLMVREERQIVQERMDHRLEYQASILAVQAGTDFEAGHFDLLVPVLHAMQDAPSIRSVQITNAFGVTLLSSEPGMENKLNLTGQEMSYLRDLHGPVVFWSAPGTHEAVAPVRIHGELKGFVWIYPDDANDRVQLRSLMKVTLISALVGLLGCTILASVMARTIARPLGVLMKATRQLIRDPEDISSFPLPVTSATESADLTVAFNLMVASMQEQRAGLTETLALLDSMLANAPTGFAFFDRKCRFVRVNQFLARMNDVPVARHLGRTVHEVFTRPAALRLERAIEEVFRTGEPVQDLELNGELPSQPGLTRNWLVNVYPVRTDAQTVRWVGAIIVDTTERRRAEDALRKTEKLAAAGRLAASIAHEINNPLEAVTNLLFLIRQSPLDAETSRFADLAQHEVARVSEITQQTLRFYRQSTLPTMANLCELLDSVLWLHQGRVNTLHVRVEREYDKDVHLFCFAGEMRQLLANLIGNALDAMSPSGGTLRLRVRRTHSPKDGGLTGVRISVGDTGCGIPPEARRRIFEPFYTTKDVTGTGLGLWVSAEIIRKHQAIVTLRSRTREQADRIQPGISQGTVFSVFFPSNPEEERPDQEAEISSEPGSVAELSGNTPL
ncbi:ATP-binding protein [Paracidobacterium acidisoli]|uniref:histidine kinase n=1 Tax=Paracidobacterium acidisoli TaxID=2303751 RepID=A0A372IQQ0_9BACT|nr:ATP-binding protein [Paracidobacterium acidisoli]MBT9331449.1 PAS domain-containing protein [Paracidobacterium acidisoli]